MDVTQRKYFPALQQLDLDVMKSMFADLDTVDRAQSASHHGAGAGHHWRQRSLCADG